MDYRELSDLLMKAFASVVDKKTATYVAGPLATGRRYYDELAAGTLQAEAVRESNELAMRSFVRQLRGRGDRIIIDSGVLRVSIWTPSEHGDFFLRLIADYCREIVFLDGWEFSSGATKEFVYAFERGIRCLDSSEHEISLEQGKRLVEMAIAKVREVGGPTDVFERRLAAIETLFRGP